MYQITCNWSIFNQTLLLKSEKFRAEIVCSEEHLKVQFGNSEGNSLVREWCKRLVGDRKNKNNIILSLI